MTEAFGRIAIVNRGEPAMRLINAVEEYNGIHGTELKTIALYTDPDRRAMFVRRADESYRLGPATFTDDQGNRQVSYLDLPRLEEALVRSGADAAWVGWGFVAERPEFAELCQRLGVNFIGPPLEVMRRLGDKIASKQVAEASEVPVAAWSGGAVDTLDDAKFHAERLGFPFLIKATAGGGGRGIRRVDSFAELDAAFDSARSEALNAFGNGAVFLETLVPQAKHIEVQIIGDSAGTVWSVGVRDCSVQRRNQKLLEEAPSPSLTPEQDGEIRAAAARLGAAAGYQNAGTVEFLFDPDSGGFWFMEVNARLQVEHPVTELTTGVDMVKLQLHVAQGGLLGSDEPPPTVGHAIEARVNAEDPDAGFAPAPGRIDLLSLPTGPGIRVDTGVERGDVIAAEFDSMIAKVIAFGSDRGEAIARLRRALASTSIVIDGGTSNKAYLQALLDLPEVAQATADVGWVDRMTADGTSPAPRHADVAIAAAAIDAHRRQMADERRQFRTAALRGRPEVDTAVGRTVELRYQGESYDLGVYRLAPDAYRLLVDGRSIVVRRDELGQGGSRLTIRNRSYRVLSSVHGASHLVEIDGHPHRISHDDGGTIRAPSPSVVVSIDVEPGDDIAVGDRLAVIEAMKMETTIEAEFAGRVIDVLVPPNSQVAAGAPLLVVRPADDAAGPAGDRVEFDSIAAAGEFAHGDCRHYLEAIRQALLGFDVDPSLLTTMSNVGATPCTDVPSDAERRELLDELLGTFADIASLFRREPIATDEAETITRRTTEEYLFDYLLHVDSRGRDLPESFIAQLRRTLAHFGVDSLDPSPELDVALHRIVVSHQRMPKQLGTVLELLNDRIERATDSTEEQLPDLLDRVLDETRHRYPAVHDLAEELRYRVFDEPFLVDARNRVLAAAGADLDALDTDLDGEERSRRIDALVQCPQPLKTMLSHRFDGASKQLQGAMLEILARRYYRIRELEGVCVADAGGVPYSMAEYDHEGRRVHLVATHTDLSRLDDAVGRLTPFIEGVEAGHDVVVDIYAWHDAVVVDPDALRDQLAGQLADSVGELEVRRIVVAVSQPDRGAGMAGVMHFTFRPDGHGGYCEDQAYRDLHPMMGKRLELWRLDEFDVRRLPSTEGIYVFHGHARENRRDERLFALAEVRDLTPLVDDEGRPTRLPEAERVIHEVLGTIRRFQSQRPATKRLLSNRILLYVWPPIDFSTDEIGQLVDRLTPDAAGLGLQKVEILARFTEPGGEPERLLIAITTPSGGSAQVLVRPPSTEPIRPLQPYEQNVVRLRQRGLVYPYELIRMMTPTDRDSRGIPAGEFTEYDLDDGAPIDERRLEPVDRPPGGNRSNIVVGVISNRTARYPEGVQRVIVVGDPTRGMGNLAEAECSRINAAFDLAERLGVPLEWFAVSSGARIAMDSGTENMDWIARVLRRIIEFTQAGGEVNIVVTGINVGAQPYWNAEATMLMHTRGILIMMPQSTMVLTGKDALDFSGGVSADDNIGIGGYERIMGPNGQAQYFARDLTDACRKLLQHYEYTYVAPGERFARPVETRDPIDRDVRTEPHGGQFATVGEVFDEVTNPGRKQPFEMRRVMTAVVDRDQPTMERWYGQRDAETVIAWDAFLGGRPVSLLGFESKNLPRLGLVPADGPDHWTSGTLFPEGSRKVARAINAASGNRPLVVIANLSGFDGSPESMRERQLEFGAEIGRAVVNFDGPIVFCVVSRYHGGAFVVFSGALNDNYEVAAIEGSKASVIGGAPAAAVVFARDVSTRVAADPSIVELESLVSGATGADRVRLRSELDRRREEVRADKMGEVADEFDDRHDINRARRFGSVDAIITAAELRPYLIGAVDRGIGRATDD